MSYSIHRFPLWVFAFLLLGCGDTVKHPVPYVSVNEWVYLSTPTGYPLQFIGGTVLLPDAGYKGIVAYRRTALGDNDDFSAYDLTCPNHVSSGCGTLALVDNLYAECPCDGPQFLLYDGQALGGSTTYPLYTYKTTYDGNALHIKNR